MENKSEIRNQQSTILIVDDDPYTLESISSLLNEHGYSVVACGNAADAMAKLQEDKIDIVLTDIKMPAVSGIELLEKIHSFNSEIPVILMTAYAELDIAIDAIRRGVFDFITKPYKHDYLIYVIEKAIKYRRLLKIEKDYKYTLEDTVRKRTQELTDALIMQKEALEALSQLEERFSKTFRLSPNWISLKTLSECRYIDVNDAFLAKTGFSKEEVIGHTVYELETWDIGLLEEVLRRLRAEGKVKNQEVKLRMKTGEIRTMIWSAEVVELGDEKCIIATTSDITEHKQAEETLRIKDWAIESSVNGIVIANLEGYLTYANRSFLKMWGDDEKEVLGKHILNFCQKEKEVAEVIEALQDEGWVGETKARRKDGSLFDVSFSASMVKDKDDNPICMMASFIDFTKRKKMEEQVQHQLQRITALRDIDMAITASLDLRVTLNVFLDQIANVLRIDAATVLLLNPNTLNLEYAVSRGFRTSALKHTHMRLGEGYAGRAALEQRIVSIPDLAETQDSFSRSLLLANEGFISYFAVPLIAKGNISGVLEIFHRASIDPDQEWLDFLEALAAQAAIAVDNASLFDHLQRSNIDLILAYDTTLEGWSKALDLRDKETEGHSQRVTDMTIKIARAMGVRDAELVHVKRGALLHDIGKMGIPDGILLKPGPLTDEEWEIMRKHPFYAHELLSPIAFLRPALDIPYCHHEKWDGTGYPQGLKDEQIPLTARIFAVVDVWDALRSDRPYRPAWSEEKVKEYIQEQAGKHFDPKVVEVFFKMKWPSLGEV